MTAPRNIREAARAEWVVIVPVRTGGASKTRLRSALGDRADAVAKAMALDTVSVVGKVVGTDRVVVVTPDPHWLGPLGWSPYVVPDRAEGLGRAVSAGCRVVATRWPAAHQAVVLGDHPALRVAELESALHAAEGHALAVVRDAAGDGTALLTAAAGQHLHPAFGPGSAQRHVLLGHTELHLSVPGLRLDVDDGPSLLAALQMGAGSHTQEAVGSVALSGMQASVHTFADGHGSVLLDDGREVPFEEGAWAESGLRHLRPGQRVSVNLDDGEQHVLRLWIVGIGVGERIR